MDSALSTQPIADARDVTVKIFFQELVALMPRVEGSNPGCPGPNPSSNPGPEPDLPR